MNKIQVSQFSRRLRTYFLQELITHCSSLTQMTPTCFEREKAKIQVHVFFTYIFMSANLIFLRNNSLIASPSKS